LRRAQKALEGADKLLEALQKLPGFDNEAVINAMGSTGNARFVCSTGAFADWHLSCAGS